MSMHRQLVANVLRSRALCSKVSSTSSLSNAPDFHVAQCISYANLLSTAITVASLPHGSACAAPLQLTA
jgi:hypothetical protein